MTNRRDIIDEQIRDTLSTVASRTTGNPGLADRLIVNARSGHRRIIVLRRSRRWIMPVAAAAAVAVVAVVATELTGSPAANPPGHVERQTTPAAPAPKTGSASSPSKSQLVPPRLSATTTPAAVVASGRWNSSELVITARSLGAVRIGMTLTQAARAAGVPGFKAIGDGVSVPTTWTYRPAATYLYLSHGTSGAGSPLAFTCVGAQLAVHPTATTLVVRTPEGVRLGDPASRVTRIYGSRATFVPQPTTGGLSPHAGYVVSAQHYDLVFKLDQQQTQVIGIFAGIAPATPSTCWG